jgi:inhibitor of KinA sporulation pathway (predicted exonuclease)
MRSHAILCLTLFQIRSDSSSSSTKLVYKRSNKGQKKDSAVAAVAEKTPSDDNNNDTAVEDGASSTFTHLLVLDFEAQCRDRPEPAPQPQEIIEFPIVVVEVATGNVVDEYHTYVRPTAHPKLYPFCTQLTGITQAQVDSGVTIDEALDRAADFAAKYDEYPNRACIVTCGHWDLRTALRNECRAKQITIPRLFRRWINVKVVFLEYVNSTQLSAKSKRSTQQLGMAGMLDHLGIDLIGHHHSGIDDARNIARIVAALLKKNVSFEVNGN